MSVRLKAAGVALAAAVILLSTLLLTACAEAADYPFIRLSDLEQPTAVQRSGSTLLKVALATGLSPSQSLARYQAVTDYLSLKLNRPVEFLQRKTYAEVDDLLREGKVDIAFVCSSSYVLGREAFGEKIVATPVIRGTTHYHSVILVNASSPITVFSELKSKSVALVDPQSTSGALYLYSKVAEQGGLAFFRNRVYTYSHDYSINAVRDGLVDGAAVDSNVLAIATERDPKVGDTLRIVDTSPAYANNPVVASPNLDPALYNQVQRTLLSMDSDPDGRDALARAGIARFVLLDDREYDSVRQLIQKAKVKP